MRNDTTRSASVTAVYLVKDAADMRPQIEVAPALGASPRQCTADIIRRSVRLAMMPIIDGTMTGLILVGATPLHPVRFQVVVVFMLLAAISLTATLVSRPPPGLLSPSQQQRQLEP